jgi:hypothetical protein
MTGQKKSLVKIAGEAMAIGLIDYPLSAGLYAILEHASFVKELNDPLPIAFGIVGGIWYFIKESHNELLDRKYGRPYSERR